MNAGDAGLASDSAVLCHQVRVVDKSRLLRRLGRLSDAALAQAEQALRVTFSL